MSISRRTFLRGLLGGVGLAAASCYLGKKILRPTWKEAVFIAQAKSYQVDLTS